MNNEQYKIELLIKKLKKMAWDSFEHNNYEKAMSSIAACSKLLYFYNQYYMDNNLEKLVMLLGERLVYPQISQVNNSSKIILYYDGFGLDLRGNAISVTKTIASLGYKLIYVANEKVADMQPNLIRELKKYDVIFEYINMSSYISWVKNLNSIFYKHSPSDAFFYTTPWDVAGVVVFNMYKGYVNRFFSDLTDHAFWLGVNTFDYILNNRTIGQSIQRLYRGIPEEKQIRSYSFLYVNENIKMIPLPFDTNKYRYIFSGGALYKTMGDDNNTFYKIVDYIVSQYDDVNFVYAGNGNDSEFRKLIAKHPNRIFLFHERSDFYQLIKGCVFYLNTYPVFGGLMMRFAAHAHKIPLTLLHNNDSDDNLLNQHDLGIEFNTYEEIVEEIDRLLNDKDYRMRKEEGLSRGYITEEQYRKFYKELLEKHTSKNKIIVEEIDTTQFRYEYLNRLEYRNIAAESICTRANISLFTNFPYLFIYKILKNFRRIFK